MPGRVQFKRGDPIAAERCPPIGAAHRDRPRPREMAVLKHKQHPLWNVDHYPLSDRGRRHVTVINGNRVPGFSSFPSGNSVSAGSPKRDAIESEVSCSFT